jgi:beta-lactamase class D
MNKSISWMLVSLLGSSLLLPMIAIRAFANEQVMAVPLPSTAQSPDLGRHFKALGIEGSIAIYDLQRDRWYQHNPQRNNQEFGPASTFKILNSLIALESGAIASESAVLTWDGIQRELPAWNRDLTMREAIKISAVWFYQVLARRVGHAKMQQWVTKVDYGNQKIGKPSEIDKFWLEGDLRITPQQQIQFLRRLQKNDLPFAPKHLATVKDIMVVEKTQKYTLRGKTGWSGAFGTKKSAEPQVGWFVGYLEQGQNTYFVATNIDIKVPNDAKARLEITRRSLKDLGLL